MLHRGFGLALVVLVLLVSGMIGFVVLYKQEAKTAVPAPEPTNEPIAFEVMNLTRTFASGVHTVQGTVTTPTPCYRIEREIQIAESYPEQVTIDLTVTDDGTPCVQVITEKKFTVEYEAAEQASLVMRLNGTVINLESSQ